MVCVDVVIVLVLVVVRRCWFCWCEARVVVCVDVVMVLVLVVVRVVVGGTHNCWLSCVAMVLRLSLCRSVCLSVCLYFDLSVCPSVCRSIGLSVCLSACLSVSVWLSLSESLHVGPFLFVSVCRCRSFCVSVVMCTSGSVLCQSLYVCLCLQVFMPVHWQTT